jgi:hypothetical protein
MKKAGGLLIAVVLLSIFMTSMVSAENFVVRGVNQIVETAEPVVELLLGEVEPLGATPFSIAEILFVKLLVFLLLLFIIHIAVSKVPAFEERGGLSWLITIIVSLLAVRFITSEALINLIWLPYGVLGVSLAAGLPFVIAFFFLESFESRAVRKVGWILLFVVFVVLAIVRWESFALLDSEFNLGWIYVIAGVLSLMVFWLDKTIHSWFVISALGKISDAAKRRQAAELARDIKEKYTELRRAGTAAERRDIRSEIREMNANLRAIIKGA